MKINEQTIVRQTNFLGETLLKKNHDYGDSVQQQFDEYGPLSLIIRIDDKFRRLKNLLLNKAADEIQVKSESIHETFSDLAGYSNLGAILYDDGKQVTERYDVLKAVIATEDPDDGIDYDDDSDEVYPEEVIDVLDHNIISKVTEVAKLLYDKKISQRDIDGLNNRLNVVLDSFINAVGKTEGALDEAAITDLSGNDDDFFKELPPINLPKANKDAKLTKTVTSVGKVVNEDGKKQ